MTYAESEAWFASFGAKINEHRHILFSDPTKKERRIFLPNLALDPSTGLDTFSSRLVDWLPNGCNRMLWLSNWENHRSIIFFETVRHAYKEYRHIIEAPGHLFESSAWDRMDYESRTPDDEREDAILSGLFLLAICFNWNADLITPNRDYITLYDNSIMFGSLDDSRIEEAYTLTRKWDLKFQEQGR